MEFRQNLNERTILDIREERDPTIQSQYSTSPTIIALIEAMRNRISPSIDIELFYQSMFNVDTATGEGLDNWGRILGIKRNLDMEDIGDWFGFGEFPLDCYEPFDTLPMWNGIVNHRQVPLHDEAYRNLLMWKAMANIATADAKTLNTLLQGLFPGQELAVRENDIMVIDLYVYFEITPFQRSLLSNYGLLAKGAGVGTVLTEIPSPCFGFAEAGWEPFDQEPFWSIRY